MNYAAAEFFRLSLSCHGRKPNTTLSPEHFEGIPRSGAGNAVAADVRAILYPDLKNSSPPAAEILYQEGILYQGASSQKFHTSG